MGRSYLFDCPKCGYKARVAGRAERGVRFAINTVACRNCKQLYDVVTRLKLPQPDDLAPENEALPELQRPPAIDAVLNRLSPGPAKKYRWVAFKPLCPVSPEHHVHA